MLALVGLPIAFSAVTGPWTAATPSAILRAPSLLTVLPDATPPEVLRVATVADFSVMCAPMLGSHVGRACAIALPQNFGLGVAYLAVICVCTCLFASDLFKTFGQMLIHGAASLEHWRKTFFFDTSKASATSRSSLNPVMIAAERRRVFLRQQERQGGLATRYREKRAKELAEVAGPAAAPDEANA